MTQWYVKELSELTQVTVQTLHHYDRIGLLKPSARLANGYRLYSEKDLLRLQQIIALKFFGFDLLQIKDLLDKNVNVLEHFSIQSRFLEEKAKALKDASNALKEIVAEHGDDKSIPWEDVIKLIEVYRMAQQLENTWAGKVFTQEELKSYANFEQEIKKRFTETNLKNVENEWQQIISDVKANLKNDPKNEYGIVLGKRCMDWVNAYYGKKYAGLRNVIWKKGYKENQIDDEGALSDEVFVWLDKAISAYFRSRIIQVLSQVSRLEPELMMKQWEDLLLEIHGDDKKENHHIFEAILQNDNINADAKAWVKQYVKTYYSDKK